MIRALRAIARLAPDSSASDLPTCLLRWSRHVTTLPDELLPIVAIIGRPNVGKSALFNRLIRERKAIVRDTPAGHVTRDWQEAPAQLGDLRFTAVDTSGLEPFLPTGTIQSRATALTSHVLRRADVALFLVDGRCGVLPPDAALAQWLRASEGASSKVVLAANKCERRGKGGEANVGAALAEAASLGFGEPLAVSAETGEGMAELYEALRPRLDPLLEARQAAIDELGGDERIAEGIKENDKGKKVGKGRRGPVANGPVKIAIMGLTNVGKSTLTNWLLQEERCLTGPEPGLTRDAISTTLAHGDRRLELVDTAGWVRRARLAAHDDSEGAVAARTLEEALTVLRFVHVVVLVVDAPAILALPREEGLTHAEAALAAKVVAEGRVLVVAANKIDALSPADAERALQRVTKAVEKVAPEVRGGSVVAISALKGKGVEELLPAALAAHDTWNVRVPTAGLNRWLKAACAGLGPGGGSDLHRVKYLSQVKARPPTFVAFTSGSTAFGESSQRFLANQLRKEFGLEGVPVRILVRLKERKRQKR